MNFPLLLDTGRNLSLLYGATDTPDGQIKRLAVVIDKTGKIIKVDKAVNASTHGSDLVDVLKTLD